MSTSVRIEPDIKTQDKSNPLALTNLNTESETIKSIISPMPTSYLYKRMYIYDGCYRTRNGH